MIVVADTSILINLCRVRHGGLLKALFQDVVIPPEVRKEFQELSAHVPRFSGLMLPEGIHEQTPSIVIPEVQAATGLDAGEAAALSLAVEIKADAILIDERRGHEMAIELGLQTIGVLGILLQAKSARLIPAVMPIIDALQNDAGFWISQNLRMQVARLANET